MYVSSKLNQLAVQVLNRDINNKLICNHHTICVIHDTTNLFSVCVKVCHLTLILGVNTKCLLQLFKRQSGQVAQNIVITNTI